MISLQTNQKNPRLKLTLLEDTNLSPTSLPTYNSYLKVFFEWSEIEGGVEEFLKVSDTDLQTLMDMYVKHLRKRVQNNEISPNTVPKVFKPMRKLLDVNYREHSVAWKPIFAQFPPEEKLSGYKPWTSEQIDMMIGKCRTLRDIAVVSFQASTGCRVGVHSHPLLMKHMIKMTTPTGEKCYAFLIYAESDETVMEKDTRIDSQVIDENDYSHFVFTTPEATNAIDEYHAWRAKNGDVFGDDTPIFIAMRVDAEGKQFQLTGNGCQKIIQKVVGRTPITRKKKRNRYDIQMDHGFRKRFNTVLKLLSEVNSNIAEKLLQHKKGLDGVYLTPTRQECFVEFVKSIPDLTINTKERQRMEILAKDSKISQLQEKNKRLEEQDERIKILEKNILDQELTAISS